MTLFTPQIPTLEDRTVCERSGVLEVIPLDQSAPKGRALPGIELPDEHEYKEVASTAQGALVYPPDEELGNVWAVLMHHLSRRLLAGISALWHPLHALVNSFTSPHPLSHGGPTALTVDWHHDAPLLAVAAGSYVAVYDMGPTLSSQSAAQPDVVLKQPHVVLEHELQRGKVSCLAWAPKHSGLLAVGAQGGICLWHVQGGAPPPVPSSRSGPWLSFLQLKHPQHSVAGVAWSPDGRHLAISSVDSNVLLIWEVSTLTPVPLVIGLLPLAQLHWSNCGNYLFVASKGAAFHLIETHKWTQQAFTASGPILTARWASYPAQQSSTSVSDVEGAGVLLMAVSGSGPQLEVLQLVKEPPSLTVQLSTVNLPELVPTRAHGSHEPTTGSSTRGTILSFDWDPSMRRLAVLVGGQHPAAGTVALYSTTVFPAVSASLLGYVRPATSGRRIKLEDGATLCMAKHLQLGGLLTIRLDSRVLANIPVLA